MSNKERFLVPVDFSAVSISALKFAQGLAKDKQSEIFLLHIIVPGKDKKKLEKQLQSFAIDHLDPNSNYSIKVMTGIPSEDIGKIAEMLDVNLVVLGTHGALGMKRYFGGYAFKIVEHSTIPMVIVQAETEFHNIKKIGLNIDTDKGSVQIVKAAKMMSEKFKSELVLLGAKHNDDFYRHKVNTNMLICASYLKEHHIPYSVHLLENNHYIDHLVDLCEEEHIDMLAATHHEGSLHLFNHSLMQDLANNKLHIPLITLEKESLGIAGHSGFNSI